jgi:NADP-dependent 3-hydroxy acid dehydrogenase YdfG
MRDLAAVAQMPHQLPDEFKEVDILINNAGLALGVTTVSDHDIEVINVGTITEVVVYKFTRSCDKHVVTPGAEFDSADTEAGTLQAFSQPSR